MLTLLVPGLQEVNGILLHRLSNTKIIEEALDWFTHNKHYIKSKSKYYNYCQYQNIANQNHFIWTSNRKWCTSSEQENCIEKKLDVKLSFYQTEEMWLKLFK